MFDDFDESPEEFSELFEEMLRSSLYFLVKLEPDTEKFIELYTYFASTDYFEFFNCLDVGSQDERSKLARMLAVQIWNNTPLPSNHYRPKPLDKPGRNAPCYCGSGKKYKQCCARLDMGDLPAMQQDMLTQYLLEAISKTSLKQVWQYLPHPLLGCIAGEWAKESEELAERALLLLNPIFQQDNTKLDHRDEVAFDAMLDLCTLLGKPRKKNALIRRIMQHSDKALQAAALHRQCCILGDQGKDDEAWQCFQRAQRIDPNNPTLSHLELLLLMQQGKIELMQQRGKFWIKRLGKLNRDGDLDDLIDLIKEMIEDTPTAMGNLIEDTTPGAARLITWLKSASLSPPPLINKLKVHGAVCIIEPKNRAAARLERDWSELLMYCDDPWQQPKPWLNMLEANPELAGSSVVIDDLIRITMGLDTPNPALTFEPLQELAMLQIKRLLPKQPKALLEWGFMENRPALRILGFLGQVMASLDKEQTGLEIMEWLLRLNPNDNQGFRSEVVNAYLRLHRDSDAIALYEHYPDDADVSLCYGHALALFRLGQHQYADSSLKQAIEQSPKVAVAISRKTMKQPKGLDPDYVTWGGEDEAWYYRQDARELWLKTPGAIAWVTKHLHK